MKEKSVSTEFGGTGEHNTKLDIGAKSTKHQPTEAYKLNRHPFKHRHGGSQKGYERALEHLVHNTNKVSHEHHKATDKEFLASYVESSSKYQKIELEEVAPAEYSKQKIDESKPVNDESPQKGTTEESIDEQDKGTADEWVPRSKELIRLVGRHPMNAEAPLHTLVKKGLITPSALHYVRNHGAVPKIDPKEHKLHISGLVATEKEYTLEDLKKFPSINIPVTLTCDGNRRKEINAIKKSRGFGWGAGGTSCAYWKGVLLCDILRDCGVKGFKDGAKYVCFDGEEKLSKGTYGTSIPLTHIMDETNDVIIAYEMNSNEIPPDHGYPMRLVVPGFVGGRQVKWLKEIKVTEKETDNFYHWHDNKVLPTAVDSTEAIEEGWFYDPNFTLYELNINSVITSPAHGVSVEIEKLPKHPIPVEGYAYSGGGRKITRVELSLDGGKTWGLAQVVYPADTPRHEIKYWTWCHWMVHVEPWKLMRANELVVRAFDASCNTQPSEPTWNLLGMMNNAWYRVKVEVHDHPTPVDPNQPPTLKFFHPVMPGAIPGGWMIKPAELPLRPKGESWEKGKKYTMDEVKKHNKKDDLWMVFRGSVYNVTSYLHDHPADGLQRRGVQHHKSLS